jgi:hypothetical protein
MKFVLGASSALTVTGELQAFHGIGRVMANQGARTDYPSSSELRKSFSATAPPSDLNNLNLLLQS